MAYLELADFTQKTVVNSRMLQPGGGVGHENALLEPSLQRVRRIAGVRLERA